FCQGTRECSCESPSNTREVSTLVRASLPLPRRSHPLLPLAPFPPRTRPYPREYPETALRGGDRTLVDRSCAPPASCTSENVRGMSEQSSFGQLRSRGAEPPPPPRSSSSLQPPRGKPS